MLLSVAALLLHFFFLDDAVHVVVCSCESRCDLPMGRFLSSDASSFSLKIDSNLLSSASGHWCFFELGMGGGG